MKRRTIHRHLYYYKWYLRLIQFLKRVRLRNGKASLYRILTIFLDKMYDDHIMERGSGVAFNFTLSIFPAIIFLFTLIPFIHNWIPTIDSTTTMAFLKDVMPENMFLAATDTISDLLSNTREGLLSFGALFSLYLAANGMSALMRAFNSCYRTVETRSFFKTRFIALGLTLILAFVLMISLLFVVAGNLLISYTNELGFFSDSIIYYLVVALRFLIVFLSFYVAISAIYYFAPAIHDRWRFFSLGSFIASLSCVGISFLFSFYVNNFAAYNKLYGSLGTLIALMIWQLILSIILLTGFEFNASVDLAASDEVVDLHPVPQQV